MSEPITANTDLDSLRERIGVGPDERLRESNRRENHLRKFAQIMAIDPDLDLYLNPELAVTGRDTEEGTNVIYIPTERLDQPITDLSDRAYELLCQEVLTLHEVGHQLYTDFETLEECRESIEDSKGRAVYLQTFNAVEDGAIERQLREEFAVADQFHIVNANFSHARTMGREIGQGDEKKVVYTVLDAVMMAILDYGHHHAGRIDRLLDLDQDEYRMNTSADRRLFKDFLPEIRKVVIDAHSEPDGGKRAERVLEFYYKLRELLEEAPTGGMEDAGGGQEGVSGRGAISSGEGDYEKADSLPDPDEIDAGIRKAVDGEEEAPVTDSEKAGVSELEELDEGASPTTDERAEEIEESGVAEAEAEESLAREFSEVEGGEAMIEEAGVFKDIFGTGASEGKDNKNLQIPDKKDPNLDTWYQAKNLAPRLRNILETTLTIEERDRTFRKRTFGQLDRRRLSDAARGGLKVMTRTRPGGEKNYSCILLLDRSGSMSGKIAEVEQSALAFSSALESLGVDTMSIDFRGGRTRLAKPFGQDPAQSKSTMATGESGGGTPLSDAVWLARQRIQFGAGDIPFVIIITDGKAGNEREYMNELEKCNFPVFGVYLRQGLERGTEEYRDVISEVRDNFHHLSVLTRNDNLGVTLCRLAREISP